MNEKKKIVRTTEFRIVEGQNRGVEQSSILLSAVCVSALPLLFCPCSLYVLACVVSVMLLSVLLSAVCCVCLCRANYSLYGIHGT
jgi:hypothetical protein